MVILLSKSLSRMQWIAIFILAAGVALVQVDSASGKEGSHYNYPVGLAAICVSCLCSGFAGELVYKYNMVLREAVKITGPEVLDVWDYFPTRGGGK